jgi:hypothetical protein
MENNIIFLRSKRSKYLRSLVSSGVFLVLSIKLFIMSGTFIWLLPAMIFLLAGIASLIPLLPNQSYLKVDNLGLTIRSMFKTISIGWSEVENFYSEKKNRRDIVSFRLNEKKINFLNLENIYTKNERLPDNYGMNAAELADLLEYYRIRHT